MKTMPIRIQRKRTKGWKMPPNTVYVGRPSIYGNRFKVGRDGLDREDVTIMFQTFLLQDGGIELTDRRGDFAGILSLAVIKRELKGKNLCCWCPLDEPCHADILLKIANE